MKKPCSSAGHRWARQTDPGLRGGGFSLPLLLFHRLVVLFFFSLVLFVPPRSNRSGKKGKKGRKKKKKRNLFFWLGVNYFLLIISQKTDPNTKASIINMLLCLCVLARKKHFFGVRRKFFFTCESSEKLRSCTHSLHSTRMLQILFIYSTRTCVYLYFSIVLQLK